MSTLPLLVARLLSCLLLGLALVGLAAALYVAIGVRIAWLLGARAWHRLWRRRGH